MQQIVGSIPTRGNEIFNISISFTAGVEANHDNDFMTFLRFGLIQRAAELIPPLNTHCL